MKLLKNKAEIKIKYPKMVCDAPLSEKIPEPLMNSHSFTLLIAPPGSGKTSMLCGLLTGLYRKVFDRIYIFMPHNSVLSLPENHLFHQFQVEDHLTGEKLAKIISDLKNSSSEGEKSLILIDDQVHAMKDLEVIKAMKFLINNRRHLRANIWIAGQTLTATAALMFRKQASHVFVWRPSRKEFKDIHEEFMLGVPKDTAEQIFKRYCENKHDFLFLTMHDGKIYNKDFDEILWDSDSESEEDEPHK